MSKAEKTNKENKVGIIRLWGILFLIVSLAAVWNCYYAMITAFTSNISLGFGVALLAFFGNTIPEMVIHGLLLLYLLAGIALIFVFAFTKSINAIKQITLGLGYVFVVVYALLLWDIGDPLSFMAAFAPMNKLYRVIAVPALVTCVAITNALAISKEKRVPSAMKIMKGLLYIASISSIIILPLSFTINGYSAIGYIVTGQQAATESGISILSHYMVYAATITLVLNALIGLFTFRILKTSVIDLIRFIVVFLVFVIYITAVLTGGWNTNSIKNCFGAFLALAVALLCVIFAILLCVIEVKYKAALKRRNSRYSRRADEFDEFENSKSPLMFISDIDDKKDDGMTFAFTDEEDEAAKQANLASFDTMFGGAAAPDAPAAAQPAATPAANQTAAQTAQPTVQVQRPTAPNVTRVEAPAQTQPVVQATPTAVAQEVAPTVAADDNASYGSWSNPLAASEVYDEADKYLDEFANLLDDDYAEEGSDAYADDYSTDEAQADNAEDADIGTDDDVDYNFDLPTEDELAYNDEVDYEDVLTGLTDDIVYDNIDYGEYDDHTAEQPAEPIQPAQPVYEPQPQQPMRPSFGAHASGYGAQAPLPPSARVPFGEQQRPTFGAGRYGAQPAQPYGAPQGRPTFGAQQPAAARPTFGGAARYGAGAQAPVGTRPTFGGAARYGAGAQAGATPNAPVHGNYGAPFISDPFLSTLTIAERSEFEKMFINNQDENSKLPPYVAGGDNSEFFGKIFLFLGRYRKLISENLLDKIYNYRSNLR